MPWIYIYRAQGWAPSKSADFHRNFNHNVALLTLAFSEADNVGKCQMSFTRMWTIELPPSTGELLVVPPLLTYNSSTYYSSMRTRGHQITAILAQAGLLFRLLVLVGVTAKSTQHSGSPYHRIGISYLPIDIMNLATAVLVDDWLLWLHTRNYCCLSCTTIVLLRVLTTSTTVVVQVVEVQVSYPYSSTTVVKKTSTEYGWWDLSSRLNVEVSYMDSTTKTHTHTGAATSA